MSQFIKFLLVLFIEELMNIWMNLLAYKKLFYEATKLFVVTRCRVLLSLSLNMLKLCQWCHFGTYEQI